MWPNGLLAVLDSKMSFYFPFESLLGATELTNVPCTLDSDTQRWDCVLIALRGTKYMGRSPRLNAILPLKVLVGNEKQIQLAHTVNISTSGVRVIMPMALDSGCNVVLEYQKNRARAVVVWSKPMGKSSREYEIGMRLLDDGQRFWLVNLAPKARLLSHNAI
jgi:hypothetical protein